MGPVTEQYQYEVVLRSRSTGDRWTMMFRADSFCHAEEQADDALSEEDNVHNEIVEIKKDWGD